MALPAALVLMITPMTINASIIGVIQRISSASDEITYLTSKYSKLIEKVRKLKRTLERELQVPNSASGILAAQDLRLIV